MSILQKLENGITTTSSEQTEAIAKEFAAEIPHNHVLAMHGDLGAGKTTFIRGLARGWQIEDPVTSPTFNLYTIYSGERQLIHLDAYRLNDGADLDSLMIEDFMRPPWCFAIEWPERIADSIPSEAWHLHLSIDSTMQHHIRLERPH